MKISAESVYRVVPSAMDNETDEGFLVWRADADHGDAYLINASAVCLWRRLRRGASLGSLVNTLVAMYSIEHEVAGQQATTLVEEFVKRGLVSPCTSGDQVMEISLPSGADRLSSLKYIGALLSPDVRRVAPPRREGFWERVAHTAQRRGVAGLIFPRLKYTPELPQWLHERLSRQHAGETERNARIRTQLEEVTAILNGAGIEPLLLKGAAYLAMGLYPDAAARSISDIDLLIPPLETGKATAALEAAGYRGDCGGGMNYEAHHHAAPLYREGSDIPVELHRAPVRAEFAGVLPTAVAWQTSVLLPNSKLRWRILDPTRQVLHAIMHSQLADRRNLPLREMADVARLCRRGTIDWHAIECAFGSGHAAALAAFVGVYTQLFDVSVPVSRWCRARGRLHWCRTVVAVKWPVLVKWYRRFAGHWSAIRRLFRLRSGTECPINSN